MISDTKFIELDAEIWDLFGAGVDANPPAAERDPLDAALPEVHAAVDTADEKRIDRIIEKARFEAVMKDSVSFLFKTMGTGVSELGAGVIAAAKGEARSAGAGNLSDDEANEADAPNA